MEVMGELLNIIYLLGYINRLDQDVTKLKLVKFKTLISGEKVNDIDVILVLGIKILNKVSKMYVPYWLLKLMLYTCDYRQQSLLYVLRAQKASGVNF